MKKFLPLIALIALIIAMTIATYKLNKNTQNSEEISYFQRTNIKLDDFEVSDLFNEGEKLTKEDLKGRYNLISFFASWCTTCKAQHSVLMKIQQEKIIPIYGIAWRDIKENTKNYLENSGNPFVKCAIDSKGLFSEIGNVNAVPETWIVDKNARVIAKYRGNLQEFNIAEIKEIIKEK